MAKVVLDRTVERPSFLSKDLPEGTLVVSQEGHVYINVVFPGELTGKSYNTKRFLRLANGHFADSDLSCSIVEYSDTVTLTNERKQR